MPNLQICLFRGKCSDRVEFWAVLFFVESSWFYPTPPLAQAQAHDTQAQAQAHVAQAHTQLASWRAGSVEDFACGIGRIALANFSRLATMLFEVFSTAVAMLFAKSAPGIVGGFADWVGVSMFGLYVGLGW